MAIKNLTKVIDRPLTEIVFFSEKGTNFIHKKIRVVRKKQKNNTLKKDPKSKNYVLDDIMTI